MTAAELFHVETVETTHPPAFSESLEVTDAAGASWCRYVIASGNSRVVGRFRGSMAQARRNAEELATSFNERARNNRSAWSPRAVHCGSSIAQARAAIRASDRCRSRRAR